VSDEGRRHQVSAPFVVPTQRDMEVSGNGEFHMTVIDDLAEQDEDIIKGVVGDRPDEISTAAVIGRWFKRVLLAIVAVFVIAMLVTQPKAQKTAIVALASIGLSLAVWIGANLVFNQARSRWMRFRALVFGIVGFAFGAVVSGNRLLDGADSGFFSWVWFPLVTAAIAAAVGAALATTDAPATRLALGIGGVGAIGLLTGVLLDESARPEFEIVPLVIATVVTAGIGAAVSTLRRLPVLHGALWGAAAGWGIGAFAFPDLGDGPAGWAIIAATVPMAIVGLRLGLATNPDAPGRARIDTRSRSFIFLAPALLFIGGTLVAPALRTLYLSFYGDDSVERVWFGNYVDIWQDPNSRDFDDWTNMFTSVPFIIGVVLLVVFAVVGTQMKKTTGRVVELGSPSFGPLVAGLLFLAFGVFTALRGTIINNLWWVVVVTLFSTALGLAVAVLAQDAPFERLAKSIIFLPMAISLVGASVIWRFMYVARDSSKEQTGVLNALWVGLGRLSTGQGIASVVLVFATMLIGASYVLRSLKARKWLYAIVALILTPLAMFLVMIVWNSLGGNVMKAVVGIPLTLIFVALVAYGGQQLTRRAYGSAAIPAVAALGLGWFLVRYWGIIGGGVGGQRRNDAGVLLADPINFVQEQPYNNVFLMVVLIWIQTGFAMVILSAAIQAVPDEIIEAARVDGATQSQIFWRVTLPQIGPTIGVVVTTIIVLVMKVYDIVKVMANDKFETSVLANDMYNQAFQFGNTGRGAALAMLIFVSVMPIMITNIRRMQREN
jgi:alpha-glucoside transport system permease protein